MIIRLIQKIKLTNEQVITEFNRRVWGQLGINYDKTTKRFLANKKAGLVSDTEITKVMSAELRQELVNLSKE
jgi:hypothetical protein